MKINDLRSQKIALGRAYVKNFNELFASHLANVKEESAKDTTTRDMHAVSGKFSKARKELHDAYETEKYKLTIQEAPSVHTMYAAADYKQNLLLKDMNKRLEVEYDKLQEKLDSGKYNYFEREELKREYDTLKEKLRDGVYGEVDKFREMYFQALSKDNTAEIDKLENSLLSNLLSDI